MDVESETPAERPELRDRIRIPDTWPESPRHDPVSQAYSGLLATRDDGLPVDA